MRAFVESVAVLAPGLLGWDAARAVLAGESPYAPTPLAPPAPSLLPAVERRRTGTTVKLALAVGQEALASAGRETDSVATVFVSSGNDGDVINDICITLAGPDRQLSPTRFHNSVHNAPSGYWGIAAHSRHASTSLCAYDWSFAIGLLEAMAQIQVEREEVMLVAYDTPYPLPLGGIRQVVEPFGTALLLTRNKTPKTVAGIAVSLDSRPGEVSRMDERGLERLRVGNPCAHALPLLASLAGGKEKRVVLERSASQTMTLDIQAP